MQEQSVIHRDLKTANIIVTRDQSIKIIDFGIATMLKNFVEEDATLCGTPNYLAPETLKGKRFGPQCDLWSLGCVLYCMLVGSPPFESGDVESTIKRIKKSTFTIPSYLSPEAQSLISQLLTGNPKHRITIDEVLTHPFLKRYHQDLLESSILLTSSSNLY